MFKKKVANYIKAYDPWSAVIFIDPVAIHLVRLLAVMRIHPNIITLLSFVSGILSGLSFAMGRWHWGSGLFLATFFFDAIDGKLARFCNLTSDFGVKFDVLVDYTRKPLCFLGMIIFFYFQEQLAFSIFTFLLLVIHFIIHKLYILLNINHCDLEFPNFHRKTVRKTFPRIVALYTFFDEQFIMFIISPLVAGLIGLPKGEVWFLWGAAVAIGLCFLKLLIVLNHRRKGRYELVHQDWLGTKGNLDKQPE